MTVKIAINGFGRIGRLAFRLMFGKEEFDIVAINDLTDAATLAHLLKYDSCQGTYRSDEIVSKDNTIILGDEVINIYSQRDPEQLPWKELDVDVVLECTGHFRDREGAEKHIKAGAKKVIISAPGRGEMKTIVYNVNHEILDGSETVVSGASCTTNCLAPVAAVLDKAFGIYDGLYDNRACLHE